MLGWVRTGSHTDSGLPSPAQHALATWPNTAQVAMHHCEGHPQWAGACKEPCCGANGSMSPDSQRGSGHQEPHIRSENHLSSPARPCYVPQWGPPKQDTLPVFPVYVHTEPRHIHRSSLSGPAHQKAGQSPCPGLCVSPNSTVVLRWAVALPTHVLTGKSREAALEKTPSPRQLL